MYALPVVEHSLHYLYMLCAYSGSLYIIYEWGILVIGCLCLPSTLLLLRSGKYLGISSNAYLTESYTISCHNQAADQIIFTYNLRVINILFRGYFGYCVLLALFIHKK